MHGKEPPSGDGGYPMHFSHVVSVVPHCSHRCQAVVQEAVMHRRKTHRLATVATISSVSLHSGGLKMHIHAGDTPLGSNNPKQASEPKALMLGGSTVDAELSEISSLIAAGSTIPEELNDKLQQIHLKLTAAQRLKSVKLLAVPDFVMQVILPESTYPLEEKVALLSELKDRDFNHLEFGLQECMWNIAADYAKADPVATREWLVQFKNAEYGVGMGLTEVLQSAKQQDPVASLKILRALNEAEAECLVTCGQIPDYDLSANEWLKEVQQIQSQRLRTYLLGYPMVYRFSKESPDAALDYILSIPKESRNAQLGYQLIDKLVIDNRHNAAEVIEWMEKKLPVETHSPEHYRLLESYWSHLDNESFQEWLQSTLNSFPEQEQEELRKKVLAARASD